MTDINALSKNPLLGFFFQLDDFVNSAEKSHQTLSDYNQFLYKKKDLKLIKNRVLFNEKMRNSGNCIYDYAYPFFGENF